LTQASPIVRDAQAGLTLVEILVVLALLSVLTGAVALSFGAVGRGNSVVQEADLLVARLNRAADEVALTATPMRFTWRDDGYAFEVRKDEQNWSRHPVPILGEVHVLPAQMRLSSQQSGDAVTVGADLIVEPRQVLGLSMTTDAGAVVGVSFDGINAALVEGTP